MNTDFTETKFVRRNFCDNPENGIFGAGFLAPDGLPCGFSFSPQPFYGCCLILSGSLTLTDAAGSPRTLKTGDIFQLFPNQRCDISCPGDAKTLLYYVCFGSLAFRSLLATGLLNHAPVFSVTIRPYLKSWMPVLVQQLSDAPAKELSDVYLNLQKFLIHLHREGLPEHTRERALLIESAKQLFFDSCLSPGISFPSIAESLGIPYETLRKLFKEETGQSPLQYTLEHKFHYAQRFLTEGKSVKETAAAVGYADPYIFSRQFKKTMGVPPSYFRQKNFDSRNSAP